MMKVLAQVIEYVKQQRVHRVVALTGAGISAESGIPTFRGAEGLWKNFRAEELATPEAFARDPHFVWEWYEWRRERMRNAEPNAAHRALAELEARFHGEILVVTQNVDGLHRKAGTQKLIELHGNIWRARCTLDGKTVALESALEQIPPLCDCGGLLRPDIVWFGEMLPPGAMEAAELAVAEADLLLVIGTSGTVYPAAGLASCLHRGRSVEINPEATPLTSGCDYAVQSGAVAAVPPIVAALIGEVR